MSAPFSVGQPASSRNWGYLRGWRLFSVIILRLLLRLLMSHQWQGKENFPGTGGVILAPNHLSYADWPTIALFSDAYGHRYPVFMIKSAVFEVKVLGPLLRKLGQLLGLPEHQAGVAAPAGGDVGEQQPGDATHRW
jgi:1-acyl-sn-glycerol-3-phosphate acyltransferase